MFPIAQNSLADVPVQNQVLPAGGPKSVPIPLDFGTNSGFGNASYSLNLQNSQALSRFSNLQTLFVDNSRNTQVLTVTIGGTRQAIKIKPGFQGYYPVMSSNPIELQFDVVATNADDAATVILLNVPMAPAEWGSAAVSQTQMRVLGMDDVNTPLILASSPFAVPGIVVGSTTNITGNNGSPDRLYLASFHVMITPDATFTAPGVVTNILMRLIGTNSGSELYRCWMKAGDVRDNPPGFAFLSLPGDDLSIEFSDLAGTTAAAFATGYAAFNFTYATGLFV